MHFIFFFQISDFWLKLLMIVKEDIDFLLKRNLEILYDMMI